MGKKNIVLIGMPGCGKSTLSKMLSKKIDVNYIDLDKYIEGKTKNTINELFKSGEDYFRNIESNICKEVSLLDDLIISTGGGVVKRKENIDSLRKNGVIIFIDRPLENIFEDLDIDERPLFKDGKDRLVSVYEERYPLYMKYSDIRVINDKNLEAIVDDIVEQLSAKGLYSI